MFGLSLSKLLFTVVVILIVWYGFKWVGRAHEMRQAQLREQRKAARKAARREDAARPAPREVEDMVECRICGSFVAVRGASNCGRADCPYPD